MIEYAQHMWELAAEGKPEGILFVAALYLLAVCTWSLIGQLRMRRWPSVEGVLLDAGTRKIGGGAWNLSDQEYANKVRYDYVVNGVSYQGNKLSPWIIQASHNLKVVLRRQLQKVGVAEDGRVTVYYNPRNPGKSVLIKPALFGIVFTAGLAYLPISLIWLDTI